MSANVASTVTLPAPEKTFSNGLGEEQTGVSSKHLAVEKVEPEEAPRSVRGLQWVIVCCSLYPGALIYGLDTSIAADIQAAVIDQFGEVQKLTWIGTAFPLGSVCAVLPASTLYNNFDFRPIFISSILLFEVGSALCGAAPTMNALIVGRAIAGLGGAGIFLGYVLPFIWSHSRLTSCRALNFFSLTTTQQERGNYIAGIGAVWGTGAILVPLVGGAFAVSTATWRWSFFVIAAICAPAYLFALPSVKPPGAPGTTVWSRAKSLDWAGFLTLAGAFACYTVALTFGGGTGPGTSAALLRC